jgi:hypothetical protein
MLFAGVEGWKDCRKFHNSAAFITDMNVLQHSNLLCGSIIGERHCRFQPDANSAVAAIQDLLPNGHGYCCAGRRPFDRDANAAASTSAIVTSLSLFRPATPTAPTTFSPTISGTPPRSVINPAVTNARRPLSTLFSVSALERSSKAEVRAFPIARSGLPARTPSILRNATRPPLASTTAMAHGAYSFSAWFFGCHENLLCTSFANHLSGKCRIRRPDTTASKNFKHKAGKACDFLR